MEWEQNPPTLYLYCLTVLHFDFHTCFQEQIMYKSRGLPVILRVNVHTHLVSVVGVVALSCNIKRLHSEVERMWKELVMASF